MAELFPNAEAGKTVLMCPRCEHRLGILEIRRTLSNDGSTPRDITPDNLLCCPNCSCYFFTENAFLTCLTDRQETGESYLSYPYSLIGHKGRNYTSVAVGSSNEHPLNNLYRGYEIERGSIVLLGAQRKGVLDEDRLDIGYHNGSHTRATLGDALVVTVSRVSPQKVLLSANLRDENTDVATPGDEISVSYERNLILESGRDSPWLEHFQEAKAAIERGNFMSTGPLLVSAVDNLLFRQILLYFRWQGKPYSEAVEAVQSYKSGDKLSRTDLAKSALDDISGVQLPSHFDPYAEEWDEFQSLLDERNDIVHPTEDPIPEIDESTAINWFNNAVDLILGFFDLVWNYEK